MKSYPLVFRCYAEKSGDQWQTFCIDLTLAAQAESFEEARSKLHAQINSYVFDAIAGDDQAHAADLLTRRAPLRYRAKYYFYLAADHFRAMSHRMGCAFSEVLNAAALVRQPC